MLAIPADSKERQLAGAARQIRIKRAVDAPIMRQRHRPPLAVIESGLRERDRLPQIRRRQRLAGLEKPRAGLQDARLDGGVSQLIAIRRIRFGKVASRRRNPNAAVFARGRSTEEQRSYRRELNQAKICQAWRGSLFSCAARKGKAGVYSNNCRAATRTTHIQYDKKGDAHVLKTCASRDANLYFSRDRANGPDASA